MTLDNINTAEELGKRVGYTNEEFFRFAKQADLSGDVLEQYKSHMQSASSATSKFGTALKSTLANIGIMLLFNGVIKAFTELSQAAEKVRQKAKELGEEFKNFKSEIEDYKEKIEGLYKTINDSISSIEDVTNARKTLMSVQDELIDKFGTEKNAINDITDAINGQVEAFDRLTQKQWQEVKNGFNDGNWWNDFVNWLDGYEDNIDRMVNTMEL